MIEVVPANHVGGMRPGRAGQCASDAKGWHAVRRPDRVDRAYDRELNRGWSGDSHGGKPFWRRAAIGFGARAGHECHTEQGHHDAENGAVLSHQEVRRRSVAPKPDHTQVSMQKVSAFSEYYCTICRELNFSLFAGLAGTLCERDPRDRAEAATASADGRVVSRPEIENALCRLRWHLSPRGDVLGPSPWSCQARRRELAREPPQSVIDPCRNSQM
jgi:hypothetical protein